MPNGDYFRDGRLNYFKDVELERWSRTDAIIERARPGPLEDGVQLERIAREAAAVEMHVEEDLANPTLPGDTEPACARILLGTTRKPSNHAGTASFRGLVAISLSSGLMSLIDVLAVSYVLSLLQTDEIKHAGFHSFGSTVEDIERKVLASPEPVALMTRFLEAWLTTGATPEVDKSGIPEYAMNGYTLIRAHAERFIVAHEYAHALIDKLQVPDLSSGDPKDVSTRGSEIRADLFAVRAVALSTEALDGAPMNVGLQGATLAVTANDLLSRTLAYFQRSDLDISHQAHPSLTDRLAYCRETYRWFLQPYPSKTTASPVDFGVGGMTIPAITGEVVWREGSKFFEQLARDGTSLHPIWRNAS